MNHKRFGFTLIEILVVLGIIAVLIAILLPAIQSARLSSYRSSATNYLKQVILASHNYASDHEQRLPNVEGESIPRLRSTFSVLGPYLETDLYYPAKMIRFQSDPSWGHLPKNYVDPLPSNPPFGEAMERTPLQKSVCSIAFNTIVHSIGVRLDSSISDGLSTTISLTEHYGICDEAYFDWILHTYDCHEFISPTQSRKIPCSSNMHRRATFADGIEYQDVVPVTTLTKDGAITKGSLPLTFQVRPPVDQCDPRIPQSSFPGGILCGFVDGSVRLIAQNVSESVFWGAVTPNKGEVIDIQ